MLSFKSIVTLNTHISLVGNYFVPTICLLELKMQESKENFSKNKKFLDLISFIIIIICVTKIKIEKGTFGSISFDTNVTNIHYLAITIIWILFGYYLLKTIQNFPQNGINDFKNEYINYVRSKIEKKGTKFNDENLQNVKKEPGLHFQQNTIWFINQKNEKDLSSGCKIEGVSKLFFWYLRAKSRLITILFKPLFFELFFPFLLGGFALILAIFNRFGFFG